MNDLVEFLRARLAEDEEAARAATPGPWWHHPGKQWLGPEAFEKYDLRQGEEFVGYGGPHPFTGAVCSTGPAGNMQGMKDAAHIARHDPARVLAEVEAKRRIVEDYASALADRKAIRAEMRKVLHTDRDAFSKLHRQEGALIYKTEGLAPILRILATVFADHPGYRPEWAPDA